MHYDNLGKCGHLVFTGQPLSQATQVNIMQAAMYRKRLVPTLSTRSLDTTQVNAGTRSSPCLACSCWPLLLSSVIHASATQPYSAGRHPSVCWAISTPLHVSVQRSLLWTSADACWQNKDCWHLQHQCLTMHSNGSVIRTRQDGSKHLHGQTCMFIGVGRWWGLRGSRSG